MIKIGDKEVIYTDVLLLRDGEVGTIEHEIEKAKFRITLSFQSIPDGESTRVTWTWESDRINITFFGWDRGLACSTQSPLKFAEINNKDVGFMAAGTQIAKTTHVTFWLLLGGKYA